jgi:hypothetical protein
MKVKNMIFKFQTGTSNSPFDISSTLGLLDIIKDNLAI